MIIIPGMSMMISSMLFRKRPAMRSAVAAIVSAMSPITNTDCILVNEALCHAPKGTLQIQPIIKKGKKQFYGRIFNKPFMVNQSGQYKDTPFRTFSGGAFIGGYSDHYPTYIVIQK